ncbi:MAG: tetratricopeptide repeat protein [Flavobacteriales bacterium]|nr:tetratricopeptide repeat protein [Flavobacteriales bacterium]
MLRISITYCLLLLSICALVPAALAQQSPVYTNDVVEYKLGLELYNKGKFGAAQKQFDKAIKRINNSDSEISVNSEYYSALCALELFNKDAEHLLTQFVENHPESPRVRSVYFQLGRYNYRKKRWENVINWFEKVDMFDLSSDKVAEYHFKKGYSYFMLDDYDNAGKILYEIKDVDTKYTAPARYYYSHIAYNKGDYQTALEGFQRLATHEKFAKIVPYYITQIYYLQKKYSELLGYAPALLDSATPKRAPEIARLIGDSYYQTKKYKESIPFLEKYRKANYLVSPQDNYQLGFANYKAGEYDKAIRIFTKISNSNDALAQTAYYHLADCYIKSDQKKFARNAYKAASNMDFDMDIQQDALYNYALLSYELSYDPYNKSIEAFLEYIRKYPNDEKTKEAYEYLVNVYMTTNNYRAAMRSIENIPDIDDRLKGAYQRVAYNSAVAYFDDSKYKSAIDEFKKAKKYPLDKRLNTMSWYWTGEALYKRKQYEKSIQAYQNFVFEPGAILQKEFNRVYYNLGYAYFDLKKYDESIKSFRKYTGDKDETNKQLLTDAHLRVADSYFLQGDRFKAEGYYQKAIEGGGSDIDYAMYQRAVALGFLEKKDEKMQLLETLLKNYPTSKYVVSAKLQIAKNYYDERNTDKALEFYNDIVKNYPNKKREYRESLGKIGLIYKNNNRNDEALAVYIRMLKEFPDYKTSKGILTQVKSILVQLDKVEDYPKIVDNFGFGDVALIELDTLAYEAANFQYLQSNFEGAKKSFDKYLTTYANPVFNLKANFYKAECEMRLGNYEEALKNYNVVISHPQGDFTVSALLAASKINFANLDFEQALSNYIMLEKVAEFTSDLLDAKVGQMKCFFFLNNYSSAIDYSRMVIAEEKVQENPLIQSQVIIARSYLAMDSLSLALQEFQVTASATQSEIGAESKYFMARIRYDQGDLKGAEAEVFELVNRVPTYAFWIAKGLILLSEVYVDTEDLFQAKATLQSILDNYDGDKGVLQEVRDKIADVEELQKPKETEPEYENIDIDFSGMDEEFEELFEEELEDE